MLTQVIWWSSIALELLLLVRGFRTKLAFRYPVFFGYLFFVLVFEDLLSFLNRWNSSAYFYLYWITEYAGVLIGCGVVLEIFRVALQRFPGTARMARNALLVV